MTPEATPAVCVPTKGSQMRTVTEARTARVARVRGPVRLTVM